MHQATPSRTIFARRLRELRVPRGFRTARSLASALGIDENRYTRYERAEVEPDLGLLMKICETLALTPNDLLIDTPIGPTSTATHRLPQVTTVQPAAPPKLQAAPKVGAYQLAGFAEDQRSLSHGDARSDIEAAAVLKRRAIAWQLARFVCQHGLDGEPSGPPAMPADAGALGTVQRTSRVFAAIEHDPFGFVTLLAGAVAAAALSDGDERRMAELVDDLVAAVEQATQHAAPRGR